MFGKWTNFHLSIFYLEISQGPGLPTKDDTSETVRKFFFFFFLFSWYVAVARVGHSSVNGTEVFEN